MAPFSGFPPNLWRGGAGHEASVSAEDERPVRGPMSPHVGHRYPADELWGYYVASSPVRISAEEEAELRPIAARIRAFDVPALAGVTVAATSLSELAAGLQHALRERVPGIAWDLDRSLIPGLVLGPAKKYGIVHSIVEAPADEGTGDAMVLELYGLLERPGGEPVGIRWFEPFRTGSAAEEDAADVGELVLRLERGTYANTRIPDIGVPFYM